MFQTCDLLEKFGRGNYCVFLFKLSDNYWVLIVRLSQFQMCDKQNFVLLLLLFLRSRRSNQLDASQRPLTVSPIIAKTKPVKLIRLERFIFIFIGFTASSLAQKKLDPSDVNYSYMID